MHTTLQSELTNAYSFAKEEHLPAQTSLLLRHFVFHMAEASGKRVTGDHNKPQGTMGRVQTAGEATSRPLSPSRLPLRAHFHQKRDVWVRGRAQTLSSWKSPRQGTALQATRPFLASEEQIPSRRIPR